MGVTVFANATLVLPDRLTPGELVVANGRIAAGGTDATHSGKVIDLGGMYIAPGFIDLHVHGGDGADFMDGTREAFRTVCRCHARHGTTSLTPTSTVARMDQYTRFLDLAASCTEKCPAARGSSEATSTVRTSPARPAAATRTRTS